MSIIYFVDCRRRRAVHHGRPAQGSVERVLRVAGQGAQEEGHAGRPAGRQVQHDHRPAARLLHETK